MDLLEISSVEIPVKKVVVEFEHRQLRQLIDIDSYPELSSDYDPGLPAF